MPEHLLAWRTGPHHDRADELMTSTLPISDLLPLNDANRLGLNYHALASSLPWGGPMVDAHLHINSVQVARELMPVAEWFGIKQFWSQTPLEEVDAIAAEFGDRVRFVAVPNYFARDRSDTFTTDWLHRLDEMRKRGCLMCKFWAAPRGRDFHPTFELDHPTRITAMRHARDLGYKLFVAHVADPDTWFATMYKDANRYGTKASHYDKLRSVLDEFHDVNWMVAHMGGYPERLDLLQDLFDQYPRLHLDASATKWMVRELSKHPASELASFITRNPGRVLFGTDIVAAPADMNLTLQQRQDLYASRFWALRTLWETDYAGPSPIVDPDLSLVDPTQPKLATAMLRGCSLDPAALSMLYQGAAERLMPELV